MGLQNKFEEYGKLANGAENIFQIRLEERVSYGLGLKAAIVDQGSFLATMQLGYKKARAAQGPVLA